MKAAQPLSDKSMETDPNEAATWFLQYENAVKSILRLGDRTTSLGMESFNASTIYEICTRLPYTIKYQTYGLEEDGREKLKKIIDMVAKARTNAERRATDKNNHYYDNTTATSRANIAQTSHSNSCTSRFNSWTLLCQGTDRQHPTTDDIIRSINYAKRPKNFNTDPGAKTNTDCRICKILESSGTHKSELYVNH